MVIVTLGTIFQAGHFVEHLIQAFKWMFGDRTVAYMSPLAHNLTMRLGDLFYHSASLGRQHIMGMEILHLIGNLVFLVTICGMLYLLYDRHRPRILGDPTMKTMRWALGIETFHLYEHIMLVTTAHYFNIAIGASTLFGAAAAVSLTFGVGFRVLWHFTMNAIPTYLMIRAVMNARRPLSHIHARHEATRDFGIRTVDPSVMTTAVVFLAAVFFAGIIFCGYQSTKLLILLNDMRRTGVLK